MRKTLAVTAVLLCMLAAGFLGCSTNRTDDKQAVTDLLSSSGYTRDDGTGSYGSEDSTIADGGDDGGMLADVYERIPFVRFRRHTPRRGVTRTVTVQIPAYPGYPDTTALATIVVDVRGELRTAFDTTTNPIRVWRKPFVDKGTRKVYLTKDDDGWHVRKVSPIRFVTQNASYEMNVIRLYAVSRLSRDTFELTTADTLLTKDELPWFMPNDTVDVIVEVASDGDSCWVFLHHGRPHWPFAGRKPYWKTGTFTFERTWYIGPEDYDGPEVRASAHDAIGWGTLWADTTQPYVASAWGIPYIVRTPSDVAPNE